MVKLSQLVNISPIGHKCVDVNLFEVLRPNVNIFIGQVVAAGEPYQVEQ
jgi:hypothetical protein